MYKSVYVTIFKKVINSTFLHNNLPPVIFASIIKIVNNCKCPVLVHDRRQTFSLGRTVVFLFLYRMWKKFSLVFSLFLGLQGKSTIYMLTHCCPTDCQCFGRQANLNNRLTHQSRGCTIKNPQFDSKLLLN